MSLYTPDRWVIVRITTPEEKIYKVLAGWYGGYLNGDSWKINSGITKITRHEDHVDLDGYSGSTYRCYYNSEGFSGLTGSIFESFQTDLKETNQGTIEHIAFDQFEREFLK